MAKAPVRARKRVRKQVSDGVRVTHWVGQPPVVPVSAVHVNPLRLLLRSLQSAVQKR
jgi:hypothetical protein